MWDVTIAGAGPAGAVAAYVLARSGRRVLLVDTVDPDAPKVGEALPAAAMRLLRSLDLPTPDTAGPHSRFGGNLSSWGSDELVADDFMREPDGSGWRLDRACFDADLRARALDAGADYRTARVIDAERRDGAWCVRLDDGDVERARWIIDASGRRAAVARRAGAKRLRDARLIALYAAGTAARDFALNRTVIEAVPDGWWYAARLPSGRAIAGFHTLHQNATQLLADDDGWNGALSHTRHVSPMLAGALFERPQALEACGARLDRFSGDGWIACGDAALSFDPVSGQGIFSALHGGMSSGDAVNDALNGDRNKLDLYAQRLEDIRRFYVARCCAAYRSESRWPDAPFWSVFNKEPAPVAMGGRRSSGAG